MHATRFAPLLLLAGVIVAGVLLAGCASGAGREHARSDPHFITPEEIASSNASNLYELVNRLRPRWMQVRAARTFDMREGEIVVYQGQTYLGHLDVLRQMNIDAAYAMRYLDGATASASLPGLVGRRVEAAIIIYTSAEGVNR
jgi:outer membrane murein-binding lipoprotein Lpp